MWHETERKKINEKIPKEIVGAKVILFTPIDDRHRYTGKTKHIEVGEVMEPASGIAICQYEGEDAFYLFGCDDNWESVTDICIKHWMQRKRRQNLNTKA